jgi:hypothetical protein
MPRVNHVKRAQQRYATKPVVDPETSQSDDLENTDLPEPPEEDDEEEQQAWLDELMDAVENILDESPV